MKTEIEVNARSLPLVGRTQNKNRVALNYENISTKNRLFVEFI